VIKLGIRNPRKKERESVENGQRPLTTDNGADAKADLDGEALDGNELNR